MVASGQLVVWSQYFVVLSLLKIWYGKTRNEQNKYEAAARPILTGAVDGRSRLLGLFIRHVCDTKFSWSACVPVFTKHML